MNRKSIWIAGFVAIFAISVIASSNAFTDASGEPSSPESKKSEVPRYSETCAHGHNGFDCKSSLLRLDITDLQNRVTELERRS